MKRRKNYFIKKRFQANFFMKFALLLFLEAFLIAALFLHVSRGTLTTSYRGTELTIEKTGTYFLMNFLLTSMVIGVAIAIVGVFVFMYLSHRVGGPIYRFEKSIEGAQKGDFAQRISLRKTDQLFDLRERMNLFLQEIDIRISHIKSEAQKALESIEKEKDGDNSAKIKKALKEIVSSLAYFKTSK